MWMMGPSVLILPRTTISASYFHRPTSGHVAPLEHGRVAPFSALPSTFPFQLCKSPPHFSKLSTASPIKKCSTTGVIGCSSIGDPGWRACAGSSQPWWKHASGCVWLQPTTVYRMSNDVFGSTFAPFWCMNWCSSICLVGRIAPGLSTHVWVWCGYHQLLQNEEE